MVANTNTFPIEKLMELCIVFRWIQIHSLAAFSLQYSSLIEDHVKDLLTALFNHMTDLLAEYWLFLVEIVSHESKIVINGMLHAIG